MNEICKHCRYKDALCPESCEVYQSLKAEYEEEMEESICPQCNGSGEGMYDGTICRLCKGTGVENA